MNASRPRASRRRIVAGTLAAVLASTGLALLGAAPAQAFTGDCGASVPQAALVADGVCEVRFTTPGAFTFTRPVGVTKVAAIVVGGGAAASTFQRPGGPTRTVIAGGAGSVAYVDREVLGSISGFVGPGGQTTGGAVTGEATVLVLGSAVGRAEGGSSAAAGNFCGPYDEYAYAGERSTPAGTRQIAGCVGAAGLTLTQLATALGAPAGSLFGVGTDAALFAAGGSVDFSASAPTTPGSGGSFQGTGADGNTRFAGAAGAVVIRYAAFPSPTPPATSTPTPPSTSAPTVPATSSPSGSASAAPTLPATGAEGVAPAVPVAAAGALLVGALLLAAARRRRIRRR